jgi:putative Mg2+ transporter-C (MgtC) family protein
MANEPSIFESAFVVITIRLIAALVIGALIGLERSYHGRPAGFRTHILVCVSTTLLMLATVYEEFWFPQFTNIQMSVDPTRMAQGIMTGIGFLGAGTIIKDGLTVRGLTTAASIWMMAAIGILIGIGFYFPAVLTAVLTLGILTVFRWIEVRMPSQFYAQFTLRFAATEVMHEPEVRRLLTDHGFTIANLNYWLNTEDNFFEYYMVIRSQDERNVSRLADSLTKASSVKEFRLSPTGN